MGGSIMTFYPYLTLVPLAFLSFFIKSPVELIYAFHILVIFFRLVFSFYSCKSNSKNYLTSFVFAVLYSVSEVYFYLDDVGTFLATIFIPMVFFGWIEWQRNGHWKMLSLGMILIIFSHVITSLIVIFTLMVLLIFNGSRIFRVKNHFNLLNHDPFNFYKLLNLVKAIGLVILTTAIFWLPALYLSLLNKIMLPGEVSKNLRNITGSGMFIGILHVPNWSFGIIDLIGLISLIWFFKLSRTQKELLILSICYWAFNSAWLPWKLIRKTPLDLIQYPSRLMVVGHFAFAYVLAYSLTGIIFNHRHLIACVILVIVALISEGLNEDQLVKIDSNLKSVPSTVYTNHELIRKIGENPKDPIIKLPAMTINSAGINRLHNLSNVIEPDYWPRSAYKLGYRMIVSKFCMITNNKNEKSVNCKLHNGKIYFKNAHYDNDVILPAFIYHGQSYKAYLDGKRISIKQHRQLMMIHNVNPSRHIFELKPQTTNFELDSQRLSIIGALIYILLLIYRIIIYYLN